MLEGLAERILAVTGKPFVPIRSEDCAGGSINRAVILSDRSGHRYFAKFSDVGGLSMFEAEREGLVELERTGAIRVPRAICTGTTDEQAFLVLEYLELGQGITAQRELGHRLARLHRTTRPQFGWHRDNTIGATPQHNSWHSDWIAFFRERRLRPQLERAAARIGNRLRADGERLMDELEAFFTTYRPIPALLHGDLWSGNAATTRNGEPVIFDPAAYFGDREADIAMTELFGGFGSGFYDAYREAWPLDNGYHVRKTLYNLYHVLNHFNLFGGGYGTQAQNMTQALLRELR